MARTKLIASEPAGPIPGENYTSDWRNYPWHRPPDITNVDEAIEYAAKQLSDTDDGFQYMAYLKTGVSIAGVTDMLLTSGIADGKWSIDFALLIAGPVARLFTINAKSYGIEYTMGTDTDADFMSSEYLKHELGGAEDEEPATEDAGIEAGPSTEEVGDAEAGGFMRPSIADEQASMLGYGQDVEEEEQL